MRRIFYNEIRHLQSAIRDRMLLDEQRYLDQEEPLQYEDPQVQRFVLSGEVTYSGGRRAAPRRKREEDE